MKNLLIILVLLTSFSCNTTTEKESTQVEIETKNELSTLSALDELHHRKTLARKDKSFQDYIDDSPNRPTEKQKTIYLLPFGNMKPEVKTIIEEEVKYLEIFFELPIKILDDVPYDEIQDLSKVKTRMISERTFGYFSKEKGGNIENLREQIQATSFIDHYMLDNKPDDAICVLGITEHDIYNPKYNYLFGSSRTKSGVGLISTFRLIDYGELTTYNIRKIVSKQIVNMFSVKNVKDYDCLLNFHPDKLALQRANFQLSPMALEKLGYNIGFDQKERFEALEKFWLNEDNPEMVEYYKKCQELINNELDEFK